MGDGNGLAPKQIIRLRRSCQGDSVVSSDVQEVALRAEGVRRSDDVLQLTNCDRVLLNEKGEVCVVGKKCRSYTLNLANVSHPELYPAFEERGEMEPLNTAAG